MKKKLLGGFAILSIAAIMVFNVSLGAKNNDVSDIFLANVEALTEGETGSGKVCYHTITTKEGSRVFYCATCSWIDGTYSWISGSGRCS